MTKKEAKRLCDCHYVAGLKSVLYWIDKRDNLTVKIENLEDLRNVIVDAIWRYELATKDR